MGRAVRIMATGGGMGTLIIDYVCVCVRGVRGVRGGMEGYINTVSTRSKKHSFLMDRRARPPRSTWVLDS